MNTESIEDDIARLCEQGESLAAAGDLRGALACFHRSWHILPEPKEDWNAALWILAAIGDCQFLLKDYSSAFTALSNAVGCVNGLGNPFVHLRLGEAAFELGRMEIARDELTRAYMGAGKDIFANEDPKYFAFIDAALQRPPGRDSL